MLTGEQARHYLFEVVRESEIVEESYRRFEAAAEEWIKAQYAPERTVPVVWKGTKAEKDMLVAIEGVLSGFARVSLFFFPAAKPGSFADTRGEQLRSMLAIDGSSPLANRTLRNHWMHFDERLDAHVQQKGQVPIGYFLQMPHTIRTETVGRTLRLIDPGAGNVHVLGEPFSLRELADIVDYVGSQASLLLLDSSDDG
jgi:hypothetical protein